MDASNAVIFEPIGTGFGCEVFGADFSSPLPEPAFARIRQAWFDHSFLVFRDLRMDPEQHVAFTRRLGPLHIMEREFNLPDHPEVMVIANEERDGKPFGSRRVGLGWHSDGEDKRIPNAGSFLHGLKIPPEGGDTLFADMYAAYAALPERLKRAIQGRRARFSRIDMHHVHYPDLPALTEAQKRDRPDVFHPLVRQHPHTGRPALYVGRWARDVEGMAPEEGRALIEELFAFAQNEAFIYRHQWRPLDAVLWDNRCMLHRAMGFDEDKVHPAHAAHDARGGNPNDGESRLRIVRAALAAFLLLSPAARAADLKVGLGLEPTSIDPHYHNFTPNNAVAQHFFDGIANFDERQQPVPGLARSWRTIDDTTWEFVLRPGLHFHDGAPVTIDDIAFSLKRSGDIPNSPSGFGMFSTGMTLVQVSDTVFQVKTESPNPIVPNNLANVMIVRRKLAENTGNAEFNSGAATIGTGPYRFGSFIPGGKITMTANPDYWGPKPAFDHVELRFIKVGASRVAALLAGDVDFIDAVPPPDIARLKADQQVRVVSGVTNRMIFLGTDQFRKETPDVTNTGGKNPFLDARVRHAISKAINRKALADQVLEGAGEPAGQLLPDFYFGTSPRLKPDAFDPAAARALLAEAGYPNGFDVVLHGPRDRYVNDAQVAQAVAQMLTHVGIRVAVETLPSSIFFAAATNGGPNRTPKFSLILNGINSGTGESSAGLRSLLGTYDPVRGFGASNRMRYSSPAFDALMEEALRTVDDKPRAELLGRAIDLAIGTDAAVVPLYFQLSVWASRRGFEYSPRADETTEIMSLRIRP